MLKMKETVVGENGRPIAAGVHCSCADHFSVFCVAHGRKTAIQVMKQTEGNPEERERQLDRLAKS